MGRATALSNETKRVAACWDIEVKSLPKQLLTGCLVTGWLLGGCGRVPNGTDSTGGDIRRDATVEAIEKVLPSVVNLATSKVVLVPDGYDPAFRRYYGGHQEDQLNSLGSGVIIDEDGYFLTNLHVLYRASRAQVKLWDGELCDVDENHGAKIPNMDLALLRIRAAPGRKFQAMKLAHDDDLLLGESVIAVGNPFGLGGTVTRGILSSKDRLIKSGNNLQTFVQTDAEINPGNSGGPLINLRGELIGINTAVGEGQGIGFAIPVKKVAAALGEFYTPEAARALWFGARVASFNAPLTVSFVQSGSPADKSGLSVGQRVISVNDRAPRNLVEFQRLVTANTNNLATLQVEDKGTRRSLKVQLVPFDDLVQRKLGVRLRNITPETAASADGSPGDGVIIERIDPDSPADQAKLRVGFVITAIDERKTGELLKAADVLSGRAAGERVSISFVIPRQFGASAGRYNATVVLR